MMESIELDSWEDFSGAIQRIKQEYGTHEFGDKVRPNTILYRGHSDAAWRLETTLDRFSNREWHLRRYMHVAYTCIPHLESYTNRSWDIEGLSEVDDVLAAAGTKLHNIPHYDYLVHLRHHGFPSPLLDWSRSPYIAAFFAFEEKVDVEHVCVFAYIETPRGTKMGVEGNPSISVQGPYVRTHERHFLQQAWYTVASERRDNTFYFVPHETVFTQDYKQDVLIKITIPMSERPHALRYLYEHNITRFSLFQTEEALVRTLAYKELEEKFDF